MWFVYLDESKEDNKVFVYSALIVDLDRWNEALAATKAVRQKLQRERGIYMKQELHAWKFAAGKGEIYQPPDSKTRTSKHF